MDINIDFDYFSTGNTKTLGIIDNSHYHLSTFSNPKLTIVIPGYKLPVLVGFKPNRINILNSNNLALTTVQNPNDLGNLPDGIYQVKYTGNIGSTNYELEKSFFRVEAISKKFEDAVLKLNMIDCESNSNNDNIDKLQKIQFLIYSVIANGNKCDFDRAINQYQSASKQLDKFLNC